MPDYIDFDDVDIRVEPLLPRFVITAIDDAGDTYKGIGSQGNNSALLSEVCTKTIAAYTNQTAIHLCVNRNTKRILQDPNP